MGVVMGEQTWIGVNKRHGGGGEQTHDRVNKHLMALIVLMALMALMYQMALISLMALSALMTLMALMVLMSLIAPNVLNGP